MSCRTCASTSMAATLISAYSVSQLQSVSLSAANQDRSLKVLQVTLVVRPSEKHREQTNAEN